jgi:hypothetical protein
MKKLIKKALKAFAIPFVTHRVSVVKETAQLGIVWRFSVCCRYVSLRI